MKKRACWKNLEVILILVLVWMGCMQVLEKEVKGATGSTVEAYYSKNYHPETLGEWMQTMDLQHTMKFRKFCNKRDDCYFIPKNMTPVWRYLFSATSAKNLNGKMNLKNPNQFIGGFYTLDKIGGKNTVLRIYDDGYLYTSIQGKVYSFYIGKTRVNAFKRAMVNQGVLEPDTMSYLRFMYMGEKEFMVCMDRKEVVACNIASNVPIYSRSGRKMEKNQLKRGDVLKGYFAHGIVFLESDPMQCSLDRVRVDGQGSAREIRECTEILKKYRERCKNSW